MMEDENWLDSDSDYGEQTTPDSQDVPANAADGDEQADGTPVPGNKRHSTYFHHPERRRTIPGAFPMGG